MPITYYNRTEMMNIYKEGATLGVGKLEYLVSTGTKQVDIPAKIELETYLQLDKLKPLSTSYTQNDNSKTAAEEEEDEEALSDQSESTESTEPDAAEEPVVQKSGE